MTHRPHRSQRHEAPLRVLAALPLSWAAANFGTAAIASALVAAGAARAEATVWLMLAGLGGWLGLAMYAFATPHLMRAWLVPGALALVGAVVVWQVDAGGAL